MMDSENKVWLVTGCGSERGFGWAVAYEALQRGHRVVATSRVVEGLRGWESEFAGRCVVLPMDVTDESLEARVTEAVAAFGRVDVLVNNAGYGLVGALEECSVEQIRRNVETNFFGPLRIMRAVLPQMREQGGGQVVNISAAAAISNYPGFSAYGAAKAALEFASEAVKAEAAAHGVKVLLIEPGPFRTGFISRCMEVADTPMEAYAASAGKFRQMLERMDGKQVGDPERAAKLIVDLVERGHTGLRVPLGKYAVKKVKDRAASVLREVESIEAEAAATDYVG
jgi:NAD(P)-dependent dehydrogenase (short-subunit alcohol dehydrogenase family)